MIILEKTYVVVKLNNEEYGIDVGLIREVSEYKAIIPVPGSPCFIEGVTNLRGEIINVISLKKKLNLYRDNKHNKEKIIGINIDNRMTGILVDDATHIITIDDKDIQSPKDMMGHFNSNYIEGVGTVNKRIIVFLDMNSVVKN